MKFDDFIQRARKGWPDEARDAAPGFAERVLRARATEKADALAPWDRALRWGAALATVAACIAVFALHEPSDPLARLAGVERSVQP